MEKQRKPGGGSGAVSAGESGRGFGRERDPGCGAADNTAANAAVAPQVPAASGGRESPAGSHERGQRRPGLA